jgi:hypothetical protein
MTGGGGSGSGAGGSAAPAPKPHETLDEFFDYTNAREGRQWAYEHFGGRSSYPVPQADAIYKYSSSMYDDINAGARETDGEISKLDTGMTIKNRWGATINNATVKDIFERMDKAFEMVPGSPQNTTVRRGTTWEEFRSLGVDSNTDLRTLVGKPYITRGYTSTSIDTERRSRTSRSRWRSRSSRGPRCLHGRRRKLQGHALPDLG